MLKPRPRPRTDDPDTRGFWEAAEQGRIVVLQCRDCGASVHLPRPCCARCGGEDLQWQTMAGTGRLYSWTVVHHQVHEAFPTPYTIVMVSLDDAPGVRLVGQLAGAPDLEADVPMRAWFEQLEEGVVLPQWRIDLSLDTVADERKLGESDG